MTDPLTVEPSPYSETGFFRGVADSFFEFLIYIKEDGG